MKKNSFKTMIVIVILIAICAAGLHAQKAWAADNSGSAAASGELERPVITALKNTSHGIKVSWEIVDGADYYCVYRKTSGDSGFTKIGQTESCEYVSMEYNLRGSKIAYKVRAVAVDGEKNKVLSPVSEVKTINFLLRPDQHMMKVSVTGTGVTIQISPIQKDAGIIIYRKGPDEAAFTRIAKTSEKTGTGRFTYTDTELAEGKYSYKVCYYKGSSKSAVSEVRALYTEAPSLKVKKTANTTKLSWNAAAGANRYQVYWSDTGSSYKCIADTDETAYVIKGYPEDYMYGSYKVRPYFKDTGRTYFGPFSEKQTVE